MLIITTLSDLRPEVGKIYINVIFLPLALFPLYGVRAGLKLFVSFPFKCYISTLVQNGMVQHTKDNSRCRYKYTTISISGDRNIYTSIHVYLTRKHPEQILSTVIRHLTIVKQWSNKKSIGLIVFMTTNHISYNLSFLVHAQHSVTC